MGSKASTLGRLVDRSPRSVVILSEVAASRLQSRHEVEASLPLNRNRPGLVRRVVQKNANVIARRQKSIDAAMAFRKAKCRNAGLLRAAGNRWHQQHFISVLKCVLGSAEEADIFFVHVDIQEASNLSRLIAQVRLQVRKLLVECGEQFR